MSDSYENLLAFACLALAEQRRLNMMDRDRLLVISATIASERHLEPLAGFLRQLVLDHNAGHMLKKYATVYEAMVDPDFMHFLRTVRRRFPIERVEQKLAEHGFVVPTHDRGERSELEVMAELFGVEPDWISRTFSVEP